MGDYLGAHLLSHVSPGFCFEAETHHGALGALELAIWASLNGNFW